MTFSYGKHFLKEVETFLKATGMDQTTFGKECVGDPNFIRLLREGRSPTARTMDKVRGWMRKQRPDVISNGLEAAE